MTTVTGLTATRMIAIEAASVVGGTVNGGGHLILTKHDASTIDAGSVIGPTGAPGVSTGTLDTFMSDHMPVCTVVNYLGTAAPNAKWLTMVGQTIVGGQTTYPAFWAAIPASMKSGSNILMPDTRGRVSVGYSSAETEFDTILETGGAKVHALSQAELPLATIAIDPPSLTVSVNPPATAVTGSTEYAGAHSHQIGVLTVQGGSGAGAFSYQGTVTHLSTEVLPDADHSHAAGTLQVDIPAFNVPVDIPSFNSGALGSGSSHNNLQPYITMLKIVKVA